MSKILVILILLILLGGGGFLIYKNYFGTKTITNPEPAKGATQFCDIQKQTCTANSKTSNSGSLKVSVTSGAGPLKDLEVDLGVKPGAPQYYLKMTDEGGTAIFEGVSAGTYVIYFNQSNFPSGLTEPAPQTVNVSAGQTTVTSINLSK